MATDAHQEAKPQEKPECFLIMPISDPPDYAPGHFRRVAEDIFRPACEKAGYRAVRADEIREANLIHLDILQKLIDSPMAICDLSTRNPNVLFELGLRQAFDKPVVLVQEIGTPPIFDIAPLRYVSYRKERLYHEVLSDQISIKQAIEATRDAAENGQGVNSLVKLLALAKPASLDEVEKAKNDPVLQLVRAELNQMRAEIRGVTRSPAHSEDAFEKQTRLLSELANLHEVGPADDINSWHFCNSLKRYFPHLTRSTCVRIRPCKKSCVS